jgi:hypothetical protein
MTHSISNIHPDWITNRLPTAADADDDGDVRIPLSVDAAMNGPEHGVVGLYWTYSHHGLIVPGQPWWSEKAAANPTPAPAPSHPEPFVVRRYSTDARPFIRGNGFDGLELGEDLEEADKFISWINARLSLLAPASAPTRKVVQIAVESPATQGDYAYIYALCNDGTILFHGVGTDQPWRQLPPIPQPE